MKKCLWLIPDFSKRKKVDFWGLPRFLEKIDVKSRLHFLAAKNRKNVIFDMFLTVLIKILLESCWNFPVFSKKSRFFGRHPLYRGTGVLPKITFFSVFSKTENLNLILRWFWTDLKKPEKKWPPGVGTP